MVPEPCTLIPLSSGMVRIGLGRKTLFMKAIKTVSFECFRCACKLALIGRYVETEVDRNGICSMIPTIKVASIKLILAISLLTKRIGRSRVIKLS